MRRIPHSGAHPSGDSGSLLAACHVALDPLEHGFSGVLVELRTTTTEACHRYEVRQTASATGNRLFVLACENGDLARVVYEALLGEAHRLSCAACPSGA